MEGSAENQKSSSRLKSHRLRPTATTTNGNCPSPPASGGESPTNPSSPAKPSLGTSRKHRKQSSDELQLRGSLWPSAKNSGTTLQDHLINDRKNEDDVEIAGFAKLASASTFSSRQRANSNFSPALEDSSISISNGHRKGRLHRSSNKKSGNPRSPSSSPSFSGPLPSATRLSTDENAGRNSDYGIDFPSTESERSDTRKSRSKTLIKVGKPRRSGSPVRRSRSPVLRNSHSPVLHPKSPAKGGGMGTMISMGLGNLFRRKSFSGNVTTPSSDSALAKVAEIMGLSPTRGVPECISSPKRGEQTKMAAVELQHKLRMAHSHLIQWRFVNGKMLYLDTNKCAAAQGSLVSALIGLVKIRAVVTQKQLHVSGLKLRFKLNMLISPQMKAMERWGHVEKHHMAALSSTKDCLHAVVCRLPLTDRSKADPQILSILLRKATNLMAAINCNISACNFMAEKAVASAAELAHLVSIEKPLVEECFELLQIVSRLQHEEESLRCHLIQLMNL